MPREEAQPLLNGSTNTYTNYYGINNSHISINNSDSSSTESIIDLGSGDEIISLKKTIV